MMEFVNWDDDIPNIWKHTIHVSNHQPVVVDHDWIIIPTLGEHEKIHGSKPPNDLSQDLNIELSIEVSKVKKQTQQLRFNSSSTSTRTHGLHQARKNAPIRAASGWK
jgi:hypothetical protein